MRFFSKTTGCTYLASIHGDAMPDDAVPISDAVYLEVIANPLPGKVRAHHPDGTPYLKDPEPSAPVVPAKVTMRQARLALHAVGLLSQVEAAIDALPEPSRTEARIEWDFSSEVFRDRDFVLMLGTSLGLTSEQMDDLFITAAAL